MSYFPNVIIFMSLKIVVIIANIADPDELSPMWHFSWAFTVCLSICLGISRIKRVRVNECILMVVLIYITQLYCSIIWIMQKMCSHQRL